VATSSTLGATFKLLAAAAVLVLVAACNGSGNESSANSDWRVVMSGLPAALTSIWGTSAQDIWAVGGDPDDSGSTVMRFDGSEWANLTTETSGDLWWVFGFKGGPVFMSGESGLILQYKDGSFEHMQTPGTATVYGIWGTSPNDMWAVGGNVSSGAFAWRYDGNTWIEAEGFPPVLARSASLFKVWGRASDDVWMVGTQGIILHYDGNRITQVASGTERNLFTVNGDGTRIAAVGGFADLEIAPQVADALAHAHPPTVHFALPVPLEPHDAEVPGAVDDGLDAEHAPLVVHLDPVPADAVLEAAGFGPPPALTGGVAPCRKAAVRAGDLGFVGLDLLAEEADDVVGREGAQGVVEQVVENRPELPAAGPHDVGGHFAGIDGPAIAKDAPDVELDALVGIVMDKRHEGLGFQDLDTELFVELTT